MEILRSLKITHIVHQHIKLLDGASLPKGSQIAKVLGNPHLVYGDHKHTILNIGVLVNHRPDLKMEYTCETD
ncbi:uncharacterized protein Bfra_007048 [Botrytis fragariae]|uniref:Uncharacterized protein n=1 Tax=Botrytis fragariae TaxID=1964551 RepID=A0A8H6AIG5_9HELO|nr:uncharacterized protein Bfra_007048 [Botrytis fragariae]KAF5867853.1 hypothetical protein Bfra_007048 [Botrytis fragariae]